MGGDVRLFGIRHHGPGSARSLLHGLTALQPDLVLVEGPSDANDILPLAVREDLEPPVALLVYAPDRPGSAVFYPFARFSPEWQAIRFALAHGIPVRFIDLPQSAQLGRPSSVPDDASDETEGGERPETPVDLLEPMAVAAGYSDTERWWDHLVESRAGNDLQVFEALHEMMAAVRGGLDLEPSLRERRREAHMRRAIRTARSDGFARIAVVCGAYHTPALASMPPVRDDDALLRGLAKVKTSAAWVPWSYERLSYASGYGAGIESPVWYELLWEHRGSPGAEWITRGARLLRDADVPASSAHVIEACRLADALAAVRARPAPGLPEYNDATVAVLGSGEAINLRLIASRWHFGGRLGRVPQDFPAAPLQQDLSAAQRRLRLPPKVEERTIDLDLREETDRGRSHLLRRLRVLGIDWGVPAQRGAGGKGTFREVWQLRWQPEYVVSLIEASRHGHTIEAAASAVIVERSATTATLAELVRLLEDALFADLGASIPPLVRGIERRTAAAADVLQLLDAVVPLVEVHRYGNVRETDTALVAHILDSLVPRMLIGIPPASVNIDDNAARELRRRLVDANRSLVTLGRDEFLRDWIETMSRVAASDTTHPLVAGYAHRVMYDAKAMSSGEMARALSLALSPGQAPAAAAAWIEGMLSGGGVFLVHDDGLRSLVDDWLRGVSEEVFVQVLPLLRRTFAEFPPGERRVLGERLRRRGAQASPATAMVPADFDEEAARRVLPLLQRIWGGEAPA